LEEAVNVNRGAVEAAGRAARAVEVALKADVASVLGVTLTFSTGDGD
jgi:hypothetical protein